MKRLFYFIAVAVMLCQGCFKDDSPVEIDKINPIQITNVSGTQFNVKQMDTLKIEPLIYCNGVDDSDLAFEWKIMNYGHIVPRLLDSGMYCCAQIKELPDSYTVRLTVTDKTTGVFRIQDYNLSVLSNFSEGLLVAYTRDEQTSDFGLVMSREFNGRMATNMSDDTRDIYMDLWASVNGEPLPGLILGAGEGSMYGQNTSLTVVTTQGMFRCNYKDFSANLSMDGLFHVPQDIVYPVTTGAVHYQPNIRNEHILVGGWMTGRCYQNNGIKYDNMIRFDNKKEYNVTMTCLPRNSYTTYPVYGYDVQNKRIAFFDTKAGIIADNQSAAKFNVSDLSAYDALYLGQTAEGVTLLAKQGGSFKALVMNLYTYRDIPSKTDIGKAIYDLGNPVAMNEAKYFATNSIGNAIYYATDDAVYAGSMEGMASAKMQWQPEPGEKITALKVYGTEQNFSGGTHYMSSVDDPEVQTNQSSENKLLLITTYNESTKEGKVTAVPIKHVHIGELETNKKYYVVLNGFGRILGVYKQIAE